MMGDLSSQVLLLYRLVIGDYGDNSWELLDFRWALSISIQFLINEVLVLQMVSSFRATMELYHLITVMNKVSHQFRTRNMITLV